MICELCGTKEATVHLTQIIDEQTRDLHLCEPCAREKGSSLGVDPFLEGGLAGLLAGLTEMKLPVGSKTKLTCSHCRMTYDDFRKTGRLGCAHCYEAFQRYLAPLLKRIHSSTRHVGKTPGSKSCRRRSAVSPRETLRYLKEQLKHAIGSEAFEKAAVLRDQIRSIEAKRRMKKE